MATGVQVVIDCTDPARLAPFWATALGYKIQDPPAGFATWQDFLVAHGVPESEWNSASAIVDPETAPGIDERELHARIGHHVRGEREKNLRGADVRRISPAKLFVAVARFG